MTANRLHVVFSDSAAGSLKQAIAAAQNDDEVCALWDDLSLGPINPPDAALRVDRLSLLWACAYPDGVAGLRSCMARNEQSWAAILGHDGPLIVWMSRRSALEYCGFMELLRRVTERPLTVVDVTEYEIKMGGETYYALTPAIFKAEEFFSDRVVACMTVLTQEQRDSYMALWLRLREENAPMRVLQDGTLLSVPLDHLDEMILSFASADWRTGARMIGDIFAADWDRGVAEKGDIFYWSRFLVLIGEGRLEVRGDLSSMHMTELRLPLS